ncbi:MAG TPA: hypothetical protein VML55_12725 [Planctomycetaceae bacterium]|nr:hypothetical protein [Planctomycetaceae bacterium]
MSLSPRGWFVVGTFAVLATGVAVLGAPLLGAAGTPPSAVLQLDTDQLGRLIHSLGVTPTRDQQRYDFQFKAIYEGEEWELTMSAVLSQNRQSIWIMAWLDELPRSAAEVPRTALLRLLANNDRLGKGRFFAYITSNRRFVLEQVLPNENVTLASFRRTLQELGASVVQTYPYWSVANWNPETPAGDGGTQLTTGQK